MEEVSQPQPVLADQCNLKYEDLDGKIWRFKRTKNPRAFIREDGVQLSHTHVLFNYEYKGRAFYKVSKPKKEFIPAGDDFPEKGMA